jgi:putative aldouronate transport system substrate-binding protein
MNNSTKVLLVIAIGLLTCGLVFAAGEQDSSSSSEVGFNETGYPIVETPVTLRVYAKRHISEYEEYADKKMVTDMEAKSNVHIEWEYQPHEPVQRDQKMSLMFASGDLPDVCIGLIDASRYGVVEQQLIPLNDYMKYAVNLRTNIYPEVPGLEDQLKFLDGNIYGLPQGEVDPFRSVVTMGLLNKKWVDNLGMKVPENLDELYDVLVAFRDKDPNGNGEADEIPTSFLPNHGVMGPFFLQQAFGVLGADGFLAVSDDGTIYNAKSTENFRDYIKFMNMLYNDGLLDPESLVHDKATYRAKIGSGRLGFGNDWGPHLARDFKNDYIALEPFVAPDGKRYQQASDRGSGLLSRSWGTVTIACEYPAVAVRWMDMFFDDEVNFWNCYGMHSVEIAPDGKIITLPPPEGINGDQWLRKDTFMGDALRFRLVKWSNNVDIAPGSNEGLRNAFMDLMLPYRTKVLPKTLLFPEEDTIRMNELSTELTNLIRNKYASWIIDGGIDGEWEDYLAKLEKLGIDEYIAIYQRSYDHWAGK